MPKHSYLTVFVFIIALILFLIGMVKGAAVFGVLGTVIELFYSVFADKKQSTGK